MPVLKGILEMDNLVRIYAGREHGDLVQNFHGTILAHSNSGAKFGCVRDARFPVDTFPHSCKDAAKK